MRTILAVLLFTALAGCNRKSISTPDGKVTYEDKGKDAGAITVTGKDGQKVTMDYGSGKIPDDYPKDIPVYKNAKVIMSQTVSEKNGRNLVLESSDDIAAIAAFYKKEFEAGGWKVEATIATGEMHMLSGAKEKRKLVVQIMASGDKRTISQLAADE
jgi:hypothetical protein